MARLNFLVGIQDTASVGLQRIANNARVLNRSLGGTAEAGTRVNRALSSSITGAVEQIRRIGEGISDLTNLRVATALVGGAFNLLTSAAQLTIGTLSLMLNTIGTTVEVLRFMGSSLALVGRTGMTAFRGIATAATSSLTRFGLIAAAVGALVAAFFLLRDIGPTLFDGLRNTLTALGETLTSLAANLVPSFVLGVLTALGSLAGALGSTISNAISNARENARENLENVARDSAQATANLALEARLLAESFDIDTDQVQADLTTLFQGILPQVALAFRGVSSAARNALAGIRAISDIRFDTFVGSVSLLPGTVQSLLTATASQFSTGIDINLQTLNQGLANFQGRTADVLLNLFDTLPTGVQGYVGNIINDLTNSSLNARLQQSVNELFQTISTPENFAALSEGVITDQVSAAVRIYRDGQAEIVRISEETAQRLGLIDQTSADRQAQSRLQAGISEARNFVRTAGLLVGAKREQALTLAAIDAGLAISGAFAHGASFGPVYLGFYVASVVASLANTVRSIRSGSNPSQLASSLGGSTPPTTGNTPQDNGRSRTQIFFQGGNYYTGEQVQELLLGVENDTSSGQIFI